MSDTTLHTPTPAFRAQLESAIVDAVRRDGDQRDWHRRSRQWRAAAIVAITVAVATGGGLAVAQTGTVTRRDSLLDAARAELALVQLQWQLARAQQDTIARQVAVGAVGSAALEPSRLELIAAEIAVVRQRMNIAEIEASRVSPRDELNAPLVNGQDYVTRRVELEGAITSRRLADAQAARDAMEIRVRSGVALVGAQLDAEANIARLQGELSVVATKRALRKEYLDTHTPIEQLTKRLETAQLRADLVAAQGALKAAQWRAQLAEKQLTAGAITSLDALRARVELEERQQALVRLAARLKSY